MHLSYEDSETEKILESFERVFEFIEKGSTGGNAISIVSHLGISRAPSIIIAFFIRKYKISLNEAYERLKIIKDDINPNDGFLIKLKAYDRKVNSIIEFQYKCSYLFCT